MTFKDSLTTKKFVVTANVNLAQAPDVESLHRQGEILRPAVDAVQLTDNPSGQVHMSSVAAAALLLQQGIEPIVHLNCRDRNRLALHSSLLGAAALGVTSALLIRGDNLPDTMTPKVRNVFDTQPKELMQFIQNLKDAESLVLAQDFQVGPWPLYSIQVPIGPLIISAKTAIQAPTLCRHNSALTWLSCVITWPGWQRPA